jgi:hypothetical protein
MCADYVDLLCQSWALICVFVLSTDRLLFLGSDGNALELGEVKGGGYF